MPFSSPNNRNPDKAFIELKVRIPHQVANHIRQLAELHYRSVNSEIGFALAQYVEQNGEAVNSNDSSNDDSSNMDDIPF